MPSWLLACGYASGQGTAASTTRYVPVASELEDTGTEATAQVLVRDSYTLSGLYVRVIANAATANSTVRSRVGGVNGNQLVTIGAGATGVFQDAVNSDALVSGNLVCTELVNGAGGGVTWSVIGYKLNTVANTTPILVTYRAAGTSLSATQTTYCPILGHLDDNTTESRSQYIFRVAATLSNMRVYVNSNTLDGATTIRTRVNGVNGNQSVSIGAGASGSFEDAANTDAIAVGNSANYQADMTLSTAGLVNGYIFQVKSTSAGRQVGAGAPGTATLAFGLTRYLAIEGSSQIFTATEGDSQVAAEAAFIARNLFVRVAVNSVNGDSTIRTRKNGANGNLLATIGASTTGTYEDLVNTDTLVSTDTLSWQVITGGAAGTMQISYIGFELAQPSAVAAPKGSLPLLMRGIGAI